MSQLALEVVETDFLLDGPEAVVGGLAGLLGSDSVAAGRQLSVIIVFPGGSRSHAASNQTRGLQLICKNLKLCIC